PPSPPPSPSTPLFRSLAPPAAPWTAWPAAWPPASVALAADAGPPTDPSGAVYIGPGTTHRTIQTADGRSRGHLVVIDPEAGPIEDRKSTRLNSSHVKI